jgi:hypothetical protein
MHLNAIRNKKKAMPLSKTEMLYTLDMYKHGAGEDHIGSATPPYFPPVVLNMIKPESEIEYPNTWRGVMVDPKAMTEPVMSSCI